MSFYSSQLSVILVREFFGPVSATVVEVLFTNGKSTLQEIHRAARLPERTVSEALTVLIQHNFVRFATLDEGPIARAYYECFFEDVYPLLRYGLEVQMVGKHTGSAEAGSLVQYLLMQGRLRIRDIVTALTDPNDIDYEHRLKQLYSTLTTLLNQQYLRPVNWWNLMSPDDLANKVTIEEEKKLRGGGTTSASMTSKMIKEAAAAGEARVKALKHDDKVMESLKRKTPDTINAATHRKNKKRKIWADDDDDDEEEREAKFEFDDTVSIAVDHKKFPVLFRNSYLVREVHKRLGGATAEIYKIVLDQVQAKLQVARDEISEIIIKTSEVVQYLPDPSDRPIYRDLVDPQPREESTFTNGTFKSSKLSRRGGYSSDEDDYKVQINGISRTNLHHKMRTVAEHLQSLADDSHVFIRPANGSTTSDDDEQWIVNLLSLRQFVRQTEMERIIENKYGEDALRLVAVIAEKNHIDSDQVSVPDIEANKKFEKLILLANKELRALLAKLQSGGILEVVEIPKSSIIERAKNYNLWSFHESRARAFLLQDLYKSLIRTYQRIQEERARKQGILKKAQRTDVKKDLKRYLSREELKQYTEWKTLEERLLGHILRVDQSVMLLRDV